ncbi:hypothetical protein QAD02_008756 [Eretmocerus hayati]|uniref:Uncharacterized protein n=1 Tax=Eretmocerus hayati TaxID=131215 RepID=A0ACC2N7R5_9HYME|nr:hypothetical protein QAD02_008756 [Eretmocerus hayati]
MLMSNRKSVTSIQSYGNNEDGTGAGIVIKRTSVSPSTEGENLRHSITQLHDSVKSLKFPHPVSFKECLGIDNVVIKPTYMEFKDGSEGVTMKKVLNIYNFGNKIALIRIREPNSMTFNIETILKDGYKLCPGMSLTRVVKYTFKIPYTLHAMIPIEINGTTVDYHLICTVSSTRISVLPSVLDFGQVDVGAVSKIKYLTVKNVGGKSSKFSTDLEVHEVGIKVYPMKGLVRPYSEMKLAVQITGKYEGIFATEFWIKSNPNIRITIKAEVIESRIIVDGLTMTNNMSLIKFPPTYLRTKRQIRFLLRNISSQEKSFIILDESYGNSTSILEVDKKSHPTIDAFEISPLQGVLRPFEQIILTVTFSPTLENLQLLQKQRKNRTIKYFVAIIKIYRIRRIEVNEILNIDELHEHHDEETLEAYKQLFAKEDVTIYLYGDVEIPQLDVTPDTLNLGNLNVDDRAERVLRIRNLSKHLPLTFLFSPKPFIRCQPKRIRLDADGIVEILVTIRAQFNLESTFQLEFEMKADSVDENGVRKTNNADIGQLIVKCDYNPLKAAAKMKNVTACRQIFFDKLPNEPNYSLTYTKSELECRKNHREFWSHYFRLIFTNEKSSIGSKQQIKDSTHCGLVEAPTTDEPMVAQNLLRPFLESKKFANKYGILSKFLSPQEIHKITITPQMLDFGMVAINTISNEHLHIRNDNVFPVMITLITPDTMYVNFSDENILLPAHTSGQRTVEFRAESFGRMNSSIQVMINHNKKYQLPLKAHVVPKHLELVTEEIIFEKECHPQEGYRIPFRVVEVLNPLNASTKFRWTLPPNSNFAIEPESGAIPANRRLLFSVYQELDPTCLNRIDALLQVKGGSRANLKVEAPLRAPNVVLLEEHLDAGEIPLNITQKLTAVLYNAEYFGAFFEVNEDSLIKGVKINPMRGPIAPRGIVILHVSLKFECCMKIDSFIDVTVQKKLDLRLRLTCSVVFPSLKFDPSKVHFKRLSCNSYLMEKIRVTNLTDAKVTLKFVLEEYPEFRISSSDLKFYEPDARKVFEIDPSSTIKLFLHFTPNDIAKYSFDLPMVMNDLIRVVNSGNFDDSGMNNEFEEYYTGIEGVSRLPISSGIKTISIDGITVSPIMYIEKLHFKFNNDLKRDQIRICNRSDYGISIILATDVLSNTPNCPFTIRWIDGIEPKISNDNIIWNPICPGEGIVLMIEFEPGKYEHFVMELPIILFDDHNEQIYNKLILEASQPIQSIESDVLEIYLVPVSLSSKAEEEITISAINYTKVSQITAQICDPRKLSGNFRKDMLKVSFSSGDSIQPRRKNEIRVKIQFNSICPVSFCTKVIFSDIENSSSVSIDIYGTADNSLFSILIYEKIVYENFLLTKQSEYPQMNFFDDAQNKNIMKQTVKFESQAVTLDSDTNEANKNGYQKQRILSLDSRKSILSQKSMASQKSTSTCKRDITSISDMTSASSYDSLRSIKSFYPFFPLMKNPKEQKFHVYRTLRTIQRWIYVDVFRYQINPKLTDGMTAFLAGIIPLESNSDKKKSYPQACTFLDVLAFLTDDSEVSNFREQLENIDIGVEKENVDDIIQLYNKILHYLMLNGASIAHISEEFLLSYFDYEKYKKNADYIMMEDAFQSRSKQSWLDIILQSYKCFVLKRINHKVLEEHVKLFQHSRKIEKGGMRELCSTDIMNRSKKYLKKPQSEAILLAWLESHCNKMFGTRTINDFEHCLSDGLVFIAVTINYCPFLRDEFFGDIFENPSSTEEKTHNANCLIISWKRIRLGFIITPSEIIHPNSIQMLMLTVHLFQTMPTYLVHVEPIIFNCPLTQATSRQIQILDVLSHPVTYVVQFFGNNLDLFSSKTILPVHPGKKQQVKINFHARKIGKSKVYLMLNGSAIGPHFAKNKTFALIGFPNEIEISSEHTIQSKLYQVAEKELSVSIPYQFNTHYEIWLSDHQPTDVDNLDMIRWTDYRRFKIPKRLHLNCKSLTPEDTDPSIGILPITVACMSSESRTYWIAFRSELADFIVQITTHCQASVTDTVSMEMDNTECICPGGRKQILSECPQNKIFRIPSTNIQREGSILQTFQKSLTFREKLFWMEYLDNSIGLRFVEWMMENSQDAVEKDLSSMSHCGTFYNVTVNKSNATVMPQSVNAEGEEIELGLHIRPEENRVKDVIVTLVSSDRKETRICKVSLLYERSSKSSSSK